MSAANTLSVSAGCTGYYVHALRNPMIKNTNFNVKIHDTVLELVREPEEWQYLCQQHQFPAPPSTYALITAYNTVHLRRG